MTNRQIFLYKLLTIGHFKFIVLIDQWSERKESMKKLASFICKHKVLITLCSLLAIIPAVFGMQATRINYDILVYLPEDIETMKGQDILTEDFNMGSFSTVIVDGMSPKQVLALENEFQTIDGVEKTVSIHDFTGTAIPKEILPEDLVEKVSKGDSQLMLVTFHDSISSDETLAAVSQMRKITDEHCKIGGMSAMVLDTQQIANQEIVIYILVAVALCLIVLMLALDSWVAPLILLGNIGLAILYNMGTNVFLGQISYITQSISAVLQLGVTTDFSIFLYHKYEKEKEVYSDNNEAMVAAIQSTVLSVTGSSFTTIAGFLTLCTMSLTLGADIGIVMAKGVVFGIFSVLVIFPAYLLLFDPILKKTNHPRWLPSIAKISQFTVKHYRKILVAFILLCIPAIYGNANTSVYYNLNKSLPADLSSSVANEALKDTYNIVSPSIILVDKDIPTYKIHELSNELEEVEGIDMTLSSGILHELGFSEHMLPESVTSIYKNGDYQALLINSTYETATNELNAQIDEINQIVKHYDAHGIVAGEGALMKDMVEIADHDFKVVNFISIFVILIIMVVVLKSFLLPFILVAVIEFAIMANMSVSYYLGTTLPFIASIVIGTIQLGATIDYAILLTNNYLTNRRQGLEKKQAVGLALKESCDSIFVSALCFFAATCGVGLISKLDMIASICTLLARGAIISMITVMVILPALLIVFDKIVLKTTKGFKGGQIA